jgi:hypothetical protein
MIEPGDRVQAARAALLPISSIGQRTYYGVCGMACVMIATWLLLLGLYLGASAISGKGEAQE